jgi:hypothetical protein
MNFLKLITRTTVALFLVSLLLISCKKEKNPTTPAGNNPISLPDCSENSGYFKMDVDGTEYRLLVNPTTHFTILYDWFGYQESSFVIEGTDQNSKSLNVGLALPGKFKLGTTTYSIDSLDQDFFEIDVDTFTYYVSKVTFDVATSNLNPTDGMYRPVKASFTGIAHPYPWYNGQAPADTVSISGTFCLNGFIMQ